MNTVNKYVNMLWTTEFLCSIYLSIYIYLI